MNSHHSHSMSGIKNFLAINVNFSNSISKIFQNEAGVELFTKKSDTSDFHIAPFETIHNNLNSKSGENITITNKENLIGRKRNTKDNCEMNSQILNKKETSSVYKHSTNSIVGKEYVTSYMRSDYILSERIDSCLDNSKVDSRWTRKEEISFICVCLVYKLSKEKIKFINLLHFVLTRTKKQFYRHYYSNKSNIHKFSELFVEYFDLHVGMVKNDVKNINEMYESFRKRIFDKDFINFFNRKVDDEKCKNYFENIYAYITFEPKLCIKSNQEDVDFYNSPKPKMKNMNFNNLRMSQDNFKSSNKNKPSSYTYKSDKKLDEVILTNLKFKIEEKLYEKLLSISKNDKLVINESFLFDYAMCKI